MQKKYFLFLKLELKGFEWKKKEIRLSKAVRKVFVRENLDYVWFLGARGQTLDLRELLKISLDLCFCEHKLL